MGICVAYSGKLRDPGLVTELVEDLRAKAAAVGWPCKTMAELLADGTVLCAGLEGITLYPPQQCEPMHFHFDQEGTFVNHFYYSLLHDTEKTAMIRQALAESAALSRELAKRSKIRAGDDDDDDDDGDDDDEADDGSQASVAIPEMPEPSETFFEGGLRYNWTKTQFAGAQVHTAVCAILRHVQQRYAADLEVTDDSGYFDDGDYHKLEAQLAQVDYLVSITSQAMATAASGGPMTIDDFVARINAELAQAPSKLH